MKSIGQLASKLPSSNSQWPSMMRITSPRASFMPIFRAALESFLGLCNSRTFGYRLTNGSTNCGVSSVESPSTTRISKHCGSYACVTNCVKVCSIKFDSLRIGITMLIKRLQDFPSKELLPLLKGADRVVSAGIIIRSVCCTYFSDCLALLCGKGCENFRDRPETKFLEQSLQFAFGLVQVYIVSKAGDFGAN